MSNRAYQYETSPRKLMPEYEQKRKKVSNTKKIQKKKNNTQVKHDAKKQKKKTTKVSSFLVINALIFFAIAFIIIYRNSLISQSFSQIQTLKSQVTEIQKENDQLEINIQNSLNLSSIEQTAKDMLGMQKLNSKQTFYLNLPKKDYVEPSTEKIILEEDNNIVQKLKEFINDVF